MTDESLRNTERRLIEEGQPLINMMGVHAADAHKDFQRIIRLQLEEVQRVLSYYIADEQMPHEWGSLDSLDDMRNSLYTAHLLMEMHTNLVVGSEEDPLEHLRQNFADIFSPCSTADGVEKILGWTWEDQYAKEDKEV
jgi:hypothetical protein